MNKKTKAALSSLEFAISLSDNEPRRDDEFTVTEYAQLANKSISQSNKILSGMVDQHILTCRKVSLAGSVKNLYSKA